uniref:Geranyl pyrophosphate synthase 2 n=1 Tax=Scoparia dulcis TaxID=107240 RepID=A0A7G1KYV4_SCODU|nr:geranyl pyrophosphate synthase 2 [Scoparia dulcis]
MAKSLALFNPNSNFPTLTKPYPNPRNPHHGPRIVSMAQNQSYWTSIEADIQTYLKKAIPIRPPESVFEPMHKLPLAAPKTTAPSLCVAACELMGADRSHAMAAAAAVHLMHTAAYLHENLPLTDRTRPKSEVQHMFGPNIELLTGDGIIPFGLELLARSMDSAQNSPDKILRVIVEITRATGSQGMVDGQFRELTIVNDDDSDIIEYVIKKKEGELHACGAACGAVLGGGAEEEIQRLRNFGLYIGMARGMIRKNKSGLFKEKIEELQGLAVKELDGFEPEKVELISSLVELELESEPEPNLVVA